MPPDGTPLPDRSRASRWSPLVVWVAIILIGTSWPRISVGPDVAGLDKLVHFGMYAVLAALATHAAPRPRTLVTVACVVVFVALFGLLDELHQSLIPGRSTSSADWLADCLGALTGALVAHFLLRWAPWRQRTAS